MGLNGHSRMHGESGGKNGVQMIFCEEVNDYVHPRIETKIKEYYGNPKRCKQCQTPISYLKKSEYNFCSHSCSATFTNKLRPPMPDEQKAKISETLSKTLTGTLRRFKTTKEPKRRIAPKTNMELVGPFSKIFHCGCNHCGARFVGQKQSKYCVNCSDLYKQNNRYKFTFNVYKYPELFDLSLIVEYGWHSYGGRFNYNPNGITRDHKVSVNEAIRNNYDPFYIKHPLNCELMRFEENNKKKTKSSVSYEDLILLVDEYELNKIKTA